MNRKLALTLTLTSSMLALTVACPKDPPVIAIADAGAVESAAPAPMEIVVFTGAPGWSGGRSCTDVRADDGCDSQWLHSTGQVVRVFLVPVKSPAALTSFVDKLAADVASNGGVVDRFTQNGLTLVRFLQAVRGDAVDAGAGDDLASINYALVGRDQRAVHLMTSIVAFDQQQVADARVRELLGFATWAPSVTNE